MTLDKSNNNQTPSSSACPVAKDSSSLKDRSSSQHSWSAWLGFGGNSSNGNGATVSAAASPVNSASPSGGCPVKGENQAVASLEEAAAYSQDPHPDQQGVALSTHRMISSIPRGETPPEEKGPHHQPTSTACAKDAASENTKETPSHWVYPSEQQFFHALRKKGWDHVEASSVPSVLEIHNTINERTWKQVLEWEDTMDLDLSPKETDLKLVRFQGRPKDMSPQAFIWTKLLRWSDPPFDRHDWYVQKQPRSTTASQPAQAQQQLHYPIQRYIIDYYMLPPPHPEMPPIPFVDARPALDAPRAFYLRAKRVLEEELPGITFQYNAYKCKQPKYYDGSPMQFAANTNTSTANMAGSTTP